jgi:hypothetical protein
MLNRWGEGKVEMQRERWRYKEGIDNIIMQKMAISHSQVFKYNVYAERKRQFIQ